jgi:hypothetical protein
MAAGVDNELRDFHHFLSEKLSNGHSTWTPEEALDEWRRLHPDAQSLEEEVAALQEALTDMAKGDQGIPFADFEREFREKHAKRMSRLFPRDLYGRLALGIASLLLCPLGTLGAVSCFFGAGPRGLDHWLVRAMAGELCVAFALFFGSGLVWAVATPNWLENLLEPVAKKMAIALFLFWLSFVAWIFLALKLV